MRLDKASPFMSFNFADKIIHAPAHSLRFCLLIKLLINNLSKYTYAWAIVSKSEEASGLVILRISRLILRKQNKSTCIITTIILVYNKIS